MPLAPPRLVASLTAAIALTAASIVPAAAAEAQVAEATTCVAEVEPNDDSTQAVTFEGALCISGTLVEASDTDIFLWQVDEADAAVSWSLGIEGVPQALSTVEVLRVAPDIGGQVARLETHPGGEGATADFTVEAGTYALVVSRADAAEGIALGDDRGYELRVSEARAEAAEPSPAPSASGDGARILVVTGDEPVPGVGKGVALEMLLDTSGSMLERLDGETKIEVAERALNQLVDRLPSRMPVALRTFKAKPRSCATVLHVPLEPLRPKAMKQTIRSLPMRKGTRTPIAKAIRQVPRDLSGVDGHRVVVLVTDGDENCGGDPAAAITALMDAGYTATVHIIGYDLPTDDALRETLAAWAMLGGGQYYEAPDRASLVAALASAGTAPYLVFDEDDVLTAQGLVGDEGVEVEAGVYRVEVLAHPPSTYERVELDVGDVEELTIGVATADGE